MAFDLDGLAALGAMAAHPGSFPGIEAEAAKVARGLLTKALKDKATTLERARAMAAALPGGTLAHVTDGMTDAELAALAARFDGHNPALKTAGRPEKAALVGALLAGGAQPAVKPAGGKAPRKAAPPAERAAPRKAAGGVEAAKKVLQSRAMGARKAAKAGA